MSVNFDSRSEESAQASGRKKPSHIPIFPDAYLRDTMHFSTEEHGAYFLLMMAAWGREDCTLPHCHKRLSALAKLPLARWKKIADTVLEPWTIQGGRLTQKRLLKEWNYVRGKRAQASAAVAQREAKKSIERASSDVSSDKHLGEGGGVGGGVGCNSEVVTLASEKASLGNLRVVEGGAA